MADQAFDSDGGMGTMPIAIPQEQTTMTRQRTVDEPLTPLTPQTGIPMSLEEIDERLRKMNETFWKSLEEIKLGRGRESRLEREGQNEQGEEREGQGMEEGPIVQVRAQQVAQPQSSAPKPTTLISCTSPPSAPSHISSIAKPSLLLDKPFKCPKPNCNKSYRQANGLKYHMTHGTCDFTPPTDPREAEQETEKRLQPFACGVGDCKRRYKNMNGLRYHYQHSGEHGALGIALLASGQHECFHRVKGDHHNDHGDHNDNDNDQQQQSQEPQNRQPESQRPQDQGLQNATVDVPEEPSMPVANSNSASGEGPQTSPIAIRKRRTHLPGVTDFLQELPLPVKLQANYDIEQKNFTKLYKQFKHRTDPIAFPEDASSPASYITIKSQEYYLLKNPHVFGMVADKIPFYLRQKMAVDEPAAEVGVPGGGGGNAPTFRSPRSGAAPGFFDNAHHNVFHNAVMVENYHHHPAPDGKAMPGPSQPVAINWGRHKPDKPPADLLSLSSNDTPLESLRSLESRFQGADMISSPYTETPNSDSPNLVVIKKSINIDLTQPEIREEFLQGLRTQFKIWKTLDHPHVCKVHNIWEGSFVLPEASMTLDHFPRGNIMDHIKGHSPSNQLRMRWVMEIASGLAYLHSNAVTHRDLRGANIFLAESRESGLRAVITNYDIPQIQVENNLLKSTERVRWMAPEILASPREAMRRPKEADIFAFGMTMLEIFSGDHPYCDKSDEGVIPAIIGCEIPQLPESMMRDDQAIAKFFTGCTLLEPFRRPLALGAFRIATGIYEKGRDYSLAPVPTEDLLTLPERPDSQINHPPWSGSSRAGINILSQSSQSASQQPSINDLGRGLPSSPPLFIVEFKAGRTDLFYLMDSSLDIKVGDLVIVEADRGKDLGKIVNDTITIGQVEEWQVQRADNVESLNLTEGLGAGTAGSAAQGALQGKEINPKMILRKADLEQEATMLAAKAHDETMALALCRSKVKAKKLPMEVIDAEYRWDRRKLTFYYVAGQKLDFRELVRELFRLYKTRIWMAPIQSNSLAYRL